MIDIIKGECVTPNNIKQALDIDYAVYPSDYWLEYTSCIGYHSRNCGTYIMAIDSDTGDVVGYINFSSLDIDTYTNLLSGTIDATIVPDNIVPYGDTNRLYYGYLSSIAVSPDYQGRGIASMLLSELVVHICQLATDGYYFDSILSDCLSAGGARLVQLLGLSYCADTPRNTQLFYAKLCPMQLQPTHCNGAIIDIYNQYKRKV